jgi:hypothetical protein
MGNRHSGHVALSTHPPKGATVKFVLDSMQPPPRHNRRISRSEISLICLEVLPKGFLMVVPRDWDTAIN